MNKVIHDFVESPTPYFAARLVAYLHKHPMASCMADRFQRETIEIAESMV